MFGNRKDVVSSEPALGVRAELDALKHRFIQEKSEAGNGRKYIKTSNKRKNVTKNSGVDLRDSKDKQTKGSYDTSDWVRNLKRKQELYEQHMSGNLETDDSGEGVGGLLATSMHMPSFSNSVSDSREQSDNDEESGDEKIEITDSFGRSRFVSASRARRLGSLSNNCQSICESDHKNLIYGDVIQTQAFLVKKAEGKSEAGQQVEEYFDATKEGRDLGAGFYQFSQNTSERLRQMAELEATRETSKQESEIFTAQFQRRQARIATRWDYIEQMAL